VNGNVGLIGTETPVDDLLSQYFPGRPDNLAYQVFESEQTALLAALLLEQQGGGGRGDEEVPADASYDAKTVAVDGKESKTKWGYQANTVLIMGFAEPLEVAFKQPGKRDRWIPLSASDHDPAEFSPGDGLGASRLWLRTQSDNADSLTVVPFA